MQVKKFQDFKQIVGSAVNRARDGVRTQTLKARRKLEEFSASVSDTDFIVPEVEDDVVAKAIKIDTTKTYDKNGRLHRNARSKSHQKHIKKVKGGHETK